MNFNDSFLLFFFCFVFIGPVVVLFGFLATGSLIDAIDSWRVQRKIKKLFEYWNSP